MKFILMHEYGIRQDAEISLCGEKHNHYDYAIIDLMDRYDFKYYHDYEHQQFLIWHDIWDRLVNRVLGAVERHNAGEPTPFDTNVPKDEWIDAPFTVYGEYATLGLNK